MEQNLLTVEWVPTSRLRLNPANPLVVAFQSDAANLVAGDTNGVSDAFVQLKKATWYIDVARTPPGTGTPGDPFTSIQYGIDRPQVVGGDTLLVSPGTYYENTDLRGKTLAIQSFAGRQATIVDGRQIGRVFTIAGGEGPGTVFEGFTITNGGEVGSGAGVYCVDSSLTLDSCDVVDNGYSQTIWTDFGGGVYAESSIVTMLDTIVASNCGYERGGGVYFLNVAGTMGQLIAASSEITTAVVRQ